MVEQDYIMRLIKEIVRTLLKLLFHIDLVDPATELLENREEQNILQNLLDLADKGDINEAENQVYELTADGSMEHLKIALLFYSHLNEKDSRFLQQHDFSRDEIKQGIQHLVDQYHLNSIADTFLSDIP